MRLTKRMAVRLEKENYSDIAKELGLTRAAVSVWIKRRSIPDKYIADLCAYLGIKIR